MTPLPQGQAIFNLLFEYGWYEFSILASADTYGINGMVYLQYLATRESLFSITDVQHFDTTLADTNIGRYNHGSSENDWLITKGSVDT